jgi:hypothetical protein
MRKIQLLTFLILSLTINSNAQLSKALKSLSGKKIPLTNTEIVGGLKDALLVGTDSSVTRLSAIDGYLKDQTVKILLPPEAKTIIDNLSKIPGGAKLVDDVIVRINRAAEDATKDAKPIFVNSIREMSFTDALQILRGPENAATKYFEQKTTKQLMDLYRPKIQESLNKPLVANLSTQQSWDQLITRWNKTAGSSLGRFSGMKTVDVKLEDYVLQQALKGMFLKIAEREKDIRTNTNARVTTLLKKVFGN